MIVFLLLRPSLLALLEGIHHTLLTDACLCEEGTEKPIGRFAEILREALRYRLHGRNWYLHGTAIQEIRPKALTCVTRNDLPYQERLAFVEGMGSAYSWCLFPWGCYGTGQMIAFISSDAGVFAKVLKYLAAGNKDLIVSSYSSEELKNEQFKGAIYLGTGNLVASELWKCTGISSESMLILTSHPEHRPQELKNAEIVLEATGHQIGNPVHRRWIRVTDEGTLKQFLDGGNTIIVTAPNLNQRVMWLAIQDFAHVADHVTQDPLYFGLKALESAAWIYVPPSADEKCEIYLNQNPEVTRRFLNSNNLATMRDSSHWCFC